METPIVVGFPLMTISFEDEIPGAIFILYTTWEYRNDINVRCGKASNAQLLRLVSRSVQVFRKTFP